ncbi:MAG: helix-turn-helix domain-containing protein [Actinobacteria bacterium]|nr:helix-turn-helix domain-containing protein [Actinomycetota bacterium]
MGQRPRVLRPYDSPEAYFGAQVRAWRVRRGLSQADLGRLVHVSGDLVAKVEKAQRRVHADLVTGLDVALGGDGSLAGLAPTASPSGRTRTHRSPPGANTAAGWPGSGGVGKPGGRRRPPAVAVLDHAVTTVYGAASTDQEPQPVEELRRTVTLIWRSYQSSRFHDAAGSAAQILAPALLTAQHAARGCDRREAQRLLALCYHAAAATATKLGATDLAWVCADRGLATAEASEDPLVIASLLRSVAHVLLATGRYGEAMTVAGHAIDRWATTRPDPAPVGGR